VSAADAPTQPRWRRVTGSPWFHLVLAFLVFGLILSFVAKPYVVPSASMQNTLQPGDRILVNRLAYVGSSPGDGDVIVFDADATWDTGPATAVNPLKAALRWVGEVTGFGPSGSHTLVKRVVGTPGQTVKCCSVDGRVVVNGHPIDEPYVFQDLPFVAGQLDCTTTPASARCFPEVTVPKDSYLMLGDHRSDSADSAYLCRSGIAPPGCWRWAHRDDIVGKAVVVLWPISRWSGL
jgi:signal peptidase I